MDEGRIAVGDHVRVRKGLYEGVEGWVEDIEVDPNNGLVAKVYDHPKGSKYRDWRRFKLESLEKIEAI